MKPIALPFFADTTVKRAEIRVRRQSDSLAVEIRLSVV
jgi:hypothetical protein